MSPSVEVQSYALVLVVRRKDLAVKATTPNSAAYCGLAPESLIGKTLYELLPQSVVEPLIASISEHFPGVVALSDAEEWPAGKYQLITYAYMDELVIEVEPRRPLGMKLGYARLSSSEQVLDLQLDALRQAGWPEPSPALPGNFPRRQSTLFGPATVHAPAHGLLRDWLPPHLV